MDEKKAIRKDMMQKRDEFASSDKIRHDLAINKALMEMIIEKKAASVHVFLPMGNEVDITPTIIKCLDKGIQLVTSESLKKKQLRHWHLNSLEELQEGIFGTMFPDKSTVYKGTYDLIVVPGLAFTEDGDRIGYGAGYYDIFLKDHPDAFKVGVAYPFQLVDELPQEAFDIQLDMIVYE